QIAPFMVDINRFFEYIDKEDIIKKIVSLEFGKFLAYYANAPEIEKPVSEKKKERGERTRGPKKAEKGFRRLFINLGKKDGFYPGEIMQYINHHVKGRAEVGQIDLKDTISFIEVRKEDAERVMRGLTGTIYKGREVRCNDADETPEERVGREKKGRSEKPSRRPAREPQRKERKQSHKNDWRQFFTDAPNKKPFKGEEPDFAEEGWARRKVKKK
ncbi:MAG: DbpA RNA binding domain-containing protein, partial [Prevotella sp.]|nr:DbpA RNA binding domain-containing protein [Prevotella sp.]